MWAMIFPLVLLALFLWSVVVMVIEIKEERAFPKFSFKFVLLFGIILLLVVI